MRHSYDSRPRNLMFRAGRRKALCLGSDKGINPSLPPGMPGVRPQMGFSAVSVELEVASRVTMVGGIFVGRQKRHTGCGPCGWGRGRRNCDALRYGSIRCNRSHIVRLMRSSFAEERYENEAQQECALCNRMVNSQGLDGEFFRSRVRCSASPSTKARTQRTKTFFGPHF